MERARASGGAQRARTTSPVIAQGTKCGIEAASDSSSVDGLYGGQPNVRCSRRAPAGLTGRWLALDIAEATCSSVDACALAAELGS